MTTLYKQLKTAADTLEQAAADLEGSLKRQAKLAAEAASAKAAQTKTASANKAGQAKLGTLAKTAADRLLAAGMISNEQNRDRFAADVLSHEAALERLAKLAQFVTVPKTAQVVVDGTSAAATADSVWEQRAQAALSHLNTR